MFYYVWNSLYRRVISVACIYLAMVFLRELSFGKNMNFNKIGLCKCKSKVWSHAWTFHGDKFGEIF